MSDLKFVQPLGFGGISVERNDLAVDSGIENAVVLSLFLDARDPNAQALDEDPRGYWASEFGPVEWGSLIWTLAREKPSQALAKQIQRYAEASLQWMVRFQVVEFAKAACEFVKDRIVLEVEIKRPGKQSLTNKYALNWEEFGRSYGLAA